MADTGKVAERLARLETSVAQGFYNQDRRYQALNQKLDAAIESLRADTKTVLEAVSSLADELRLHTEPPLVGAPQRGQHPQQAGAARYPEKAPHDHLRGVAIQRAAHAEQRGVDEGAAEDPA